MPKMIFERLNTHGVVSLLVLVLLQVFYASSTVTTVTKECTNVPHKCTAKDPRAIYPRCMQGKDLLLWCDQTNFTGIPDPDSIYSFKSCRNAIGLFINDSCLHELKQDELRKYQNIEIFKCDRNYVSEIPSNLFSKNPKLGRIDFCRNRISVIGKGAFTGLPNLKYLNLDNNKIDELHPDMFRGLGNLIEISFHNNKIAVLQRRTFAGFNRLEVLTLTANKIGHINEAAFDDLDNLKRLHLDDNKLYELRLETFSNLQNLEVLTLSYNKFVIWPDFGQKSLGNLHSLNLGHNLLEKFEASNVANLSKLQNLSLENNSLQVLQEDLFRSTPNLRFLNVSNNNIEHIGQYTFFRLCHLETLVLRSNRLKTPHVEWFSGLAKAGMPQGNDIAENPWDCNCAVIRHYSFLRTLPHKFREALEIRCASPKQFDGQTVDKYTISEMQSKYQCSKEETNYIEEGYSCNETEKFTRIPVVSTYTPTTEKESPASTSENSYEDDGSSSKLKQMDENNKIEISKQIQPDYLGIILITVAILLSLVLIAFFLVLRNRQSKQKGSQDYCDERKHAPEDRRSEFGSGTYNRLNPEWRIQNRTNVVRSSESSVDGSTRLLPRNSPNQPGTTSDTTYYTSMSPIPPSEVTSSVTSAEGRSTRQALSQNETVTTVYPTTDIARRPSNTVPKTVVGEESDTLFNTAPRPPEPRGQRLEPEGANC